MFTAPRCQADHRFPREYDKIKKFIAAFMPDFTGQIDLYDGPEPIFDGYGIEIE